MDELKRTIERLRALDERRAALVEYRDRQIVELVSGEHTWAEVQQATGLSARGLQMSVKRGRSK